MLSGKEKVRARMIHRMSLWGNKNKVRKSNEGDFEMMNLEDFVAGSSGIEKLSRRTLFNAAVEADLQLKDGSLKGNQRLINRRQRQDKKFLAAFKEKNRVARGLPKSRLVPTMRSESPRFPSSKMMSAEEIRRTGKTYFGEKISGRGAKTIRRLLYPHR